MHTESRRARHRDPARVLPPVLLVAGLGYAAVLVLSAVNLVVPLSFYEPAAEAARFAFGVFGLVAAVRAARTAQLPSRLRQAWGAVAACFSVLVVTVPLLMILSDGDSGWDEATHVFFMVACLIALQRFPLAPTGRRDRVKAAVDALTVVAGGSVVLWYFAIGPLLERSGLSVEILITAVVYPLGDLALLFCAVRALLRGADASAQRPLQLLTAAALVLFTGDAVHGYLAGHNGTEMPVTWHFVCWITADALLAAGAAEQSRSRSAAVVASGARRTAGAGRFLPFLAVAVAHLLMLAEAWQDDRFFPWGGLALGGAMLSVLVLFRQTLAQRESDERALTDGLTGLANRSMFRRMSYHALGRGRRTAILMIDMNGFKRINDTLGHKAGDRVLAEFAEVLRRCVPKPGLPARLGGDEFAVLLPGIARSEEAYELAGRLAGALGPVAVDGRLITLAASIGVAVTEPGELTHDDLVHRADLAMYRAKSMGPDTRWAIWQESMEPPAEATALPVAA